MAVFSSLAVAVAILLLLAVLCDSAVATFSGALFMLCSPFASPFTSPCAARSFCVFFIVLSSVSLPIDELLSVSKSLLSLIGLIYCCFVTVFCYAELSARVGVVSSEL